MRNGNILTYLRTENGSQADRIALVHQMAQGMEYLHLHDIMHGDFKVSSDHLTRPLINRSIGGKRPC